MASWQPPIPAGALYSKAARALGPALPLLAYCYDMVGRDGWFDLSLKDAANDMEESYQTIKRYWWSLKAGPFFVEMSDRGRKGWRIRFKDVWIDWRILNARPSNDTFSRSDEGTEMDLENEAHQEVVAQGHLKVISRSDEGTEMDLDTSGIKVLMTHDQALFAVAADAAPPQRTSKPKKSDRVPTEHARLMKLYQDALPDKRIPNGGREAKAAKEILAAGYTPEQAIQVYQYLKRQNFYAGKHLSLSTVNTEIGAALAAIKNGTGSNNGRNLQSHPRQPLERAQWRPYSADDEIIRPPDRHD